MQQKIRSEDIVDAAHQQQTPGGDEDAPPNVPWEKSHSATEPHTNGGPPGTNYRKNVTKPSTSA